MTSYYDYYRFDHAHAMCTHAHTMRTHAHACARHAHAMRTPCARCAHTMPSHVHGHKVCNNARRKLIFGPVIALDLFIIILYTSESDNTSDIGIIVFMAEAMKSLLLLSTVCHCVDKASWAPTARTLVYNKNLELS